ncbi:MAG: hypothetical protein Unbinned4026contig1002_35 [Prokaryotic dsDNA virus sp.]|mgnify:CR=1 FL=1|nr:MAG: hypothetical protein Unbinned4026contig1002_35 [Prokaryotic dsDNA virus sp.]|tara:strand:- start:3112 stop:3387 length:276 start_codon:yes stop_codon:yes gene_type:complete
MAITKTTELAKIEVVGEYKFIQVKTDIVIKEDDNEISRTVHRIAYQPGTVNEISGVYEETDLSSEHQEVQDIANLVWTDAVQTAWQNKLTN